MASSVDIEVPVDSDEFAVTIAPVAERRLDIQAAPVFDESQMSKFVALRGPGWAARNLRKFATDVEGRLAALDATTPSDLARITHGMIMMAAQCGFTELLNVSEVVQLEARQDFGLNRVVELRAAGERVLAALRSYTPRP